MNPAKKVALIAFALSLQGLIPYLVNDRSPLPLLSLVWLILSALLWKQSKTAFRIFRFLIWFIFIITLSIELAIIFRAPSETYFSKLFVANSWAATIAYFTLWVVGFAAVLYYTETDKVRQAFNLPLKSKRVNNPGDEQSGEYGEHSTDIRE
jgi:hypothetical protein